jgi:hypothetical protein
MYGRDDRFQFYFEYLKITSSPPPRIDVRSPHAIRLVFLHIELVFVVNPRTAQNPTACPSLPLVSNAAPLAANKTGQRGAARSQQNRPHPRFTSAPTTSATSFSTSTTRRRSQPTKPAAPALHFGSNQVGHLLLHPLRRSSCSAPLPEASWVFSPFALRLSRTPTIMLGMMLDLLFTTPH